MKATPTKTIKLFKQIQLVFLALFFISTQSFVFADCTWTTTGASTVWSNAGSWSVVYSGSGPACATFPPTGDIASGDRVIINHNINLTTSSYIVKTGGTLTINSGATFSVTGNMDLQNGSNFTVNQGGILNVSGNFNNSNNSTGVVVNGTVNIGGNLTSGSGSTVTSPTMTGAFVVQGSISGAGTVFGSTADCGDTAVPCVTNASSPLPVEFGKLDMICDTRRITLTWETYSEFNSDYFMVYRSMDGNFWEILSKIPSAGFSTDVLKYEFIDSVPLNNSYYMITQVDKNGDTKQYPVISSDCELNEVFAYPNPFTNELVFRNCKNSIITIYNNIGLPILRVNAISDVEILDVLNLSSGSYYAIIESEGMFNLIKLMK